MPPSPLLRLESVWEDGDLFELAIYAVSGPFAGEARSYSTRASVSAFRSRLSTMSLRGGEVISFEASGGPQAPHFSVSIAPLDALGHLIVRVMLVSEPIAHRYSLNQCAEFSFRSDPTALDAFASSLSHVARAPIGASAILAGHV
jgi:hypothetical protein